MAKRENDLGRDPIGKLLLRLAVPTVTAQLVNALYNIVDPSTSGTSPVRAISPSPAWASASP